MDKAEFYRGLVATLKASRPDKRSMDIASQLCTPEHEARTRALFALLEMFANLSADQQERLMPCAVACASMIHGYVNEFDFRKMLSGWTEPDSADFRQAVLAADFNLSADGCQEEPT